MQRNSATLDFIRQHRDEDVRKLAFLGSKYPEVDFPFALDQIRGRQMARTKLPRWAATDGIVYPPHLSMEQCSSEQTASYKAELAARLLGLKEPKGAKDSENPQFTEICEFATEDAVAPKFAKNEGIYENGQKIEFVDLTGGFGVDFSYIAARLGVRAMYVERQAHLCEAARENFQLLGLENAIVENADGVEMLHSLDRLRLIFIDPARRDDAGNKVVSLQDCTPDVTQLQEEMLRKADFVIVKLSPMLDWHRAVSELSHVREVHIVSVGNECKELLLVLSSQAEAPLRVFCVNDGQRMAYGAEESPVVRIADETALDSWLYEPNASLMKAGCFGAVCERYGVEMLAKNSHLFVSQQMVGGFPGRTFRILSVCSLNKKELKRHLAGVEQANIATRNFPLSVAELRKRLKLRDGGETYIFATTLADERHVLIVAEKATAFHNP